MTTAPPTDQTPVTPNPNPTPTPAGKASTNNWDTAFGIKFGSANAAIKAQKSSPPSFSGTKPGGGFSGPAIEVAGDFGDWQLSGGSGSLAQLMLPISGTATAEEQPPQVIKFHGSAVIQVSLAYLDEHGNEVDPNVSSAAGKNFLKLRTSTPDPQEQPVVSIMSISLNPEAEEAQDAISDVLLGWLDANLSAFDHTFAAVDVGELADKDEFQWLKPTKLGYAISNPEGAPPDDYIFAVLAMTENREGENLSPAVSPNIIPTGCNAGFLISQERFMTKIMKPGITQLFLNATQDDFSVVGDGSTITNLNKVQFNNFITEAADGSDPTTITGANVDAQKFNLIANATTLSLSFVDLNFPWGDDGGYTVSITYQAESQLFMDTNKHLQAFTVGKPSLSVTVTESTAEKWKNIIDGMIEGIALAVAGAMIGGALGPEADAAADGLEDAGTDSLTDVAGTDDPLEFSWDEFPPDEDVENLDEVNSDDDADAKDDVANADDESYVSKFKGWFRRNWRKLLGMAIGGAVGVVVGKLPDILEAYSENDLAKMPTMDEFVDYSVSATTWPNQTGYTLQNLALNESLQFGLDVQIDPTPAK